MQKAFTVIEVLIVIAIIAILASFVIPAYQRYTYKLWIENETHKIYMILKKVQLDAKTRKEVRCIKLSSDGKELQIFNNTSCSSLIQSVTLNVPFEISSSSGSELKINKFGIFSSIGNIHIQGDTPSGTINCVKADRFRICEGTWDGSNCNCKF